jgi:hypothetical protein
MSYVLGLFIAYNSLQINQLQIYLVIREKSRILCKQFTN